MAAKTATREIVVNRVIDAPRELVFAAFTEREHIEQWWAPKGPEGGSRGGVAPTLFLSVL
ncbi:MAG TPA: SRPBCC domain-containing protein [Anaerolineales bacterium]|nr:SRPBCC domain-containing protein [Anaerolineales bacterium]